MSILKNEVGRPSNETLKIRRILKGLIFVVVLAICYLGGYMLGSNLGDNRDKNETNTNKEELSIDDKEELSIDDKEVVELFNRMHYTFFVDSMSLFGYNGYFYSKDKITIEDVDDNIKFAVSMYELHGEQIYNESEKYDANEIDKKSVVIFGKGIENRNSIFRLRGIEYKYLDGKYLFNDGLGIGDASSINIYTKLISAYKEKNKMIITNKMMAVFSGICHDDEKYNFEYGIYKNIGENEKLLNKIDEFKTVNSEIIKIEDYMDKLDTYKWTFTKNNDGNYIFTSVEKVK